MNSVKLLAALSAIAILAILVPAPQSAQALMYGNPTCQSNSCASYDANCELVYTSKEEIDYFTCCERSWIGIYVPRAYAEATQTKGYECPDLSTVQHCVSRYPISGQPTAECALTATATPASPRPPITGE